MGTSTSQKRNVLAEYKLVATTHPQVQVREMAAQVIADMETELQLKRTGIGAPGLSGGASPIAGAPWNEIIDVTTKSYNKYKRTRNIPRVFEEMVRTTKGKYVDRRGKEITKSQYDKHGGKILQPSEWKLLGPQGVSEEKRQELVALRESLTHVLKKEDQEIPLSDNEKSALQSYRSKLRDARMGKYPEKQLQGPLLKDIPFPFVWPSRKLQKRFKGRAHESELFSEINVLGAGGGRNRCDMCGRLGSQCGQLFQQGLFELCSDCCKTSEQKSLLKQGLAMFSQGSQKHVKESSKWKSLFLGD